MTGTGSAGAPPGRCIRFRKYLGERPEPVAWPAGVSLARFDERRHPLALHQLFARAYGGGGGDVGAFDSWWAALRGDAEYDPALVFLAVDDTGVLVGAAQCWTSEFVKDLAVADAWRGKGVGRALLQHAFCRFRELGAAYLDLKVEVDNPSQAARFYRRLGMIEVA